jgi:hypothetical protein
MKACYLIAMLALAGCQPTASVIADAPKIMTYQELVDYPVDCKFKETQVAELKKLQAIKNFEPDPDVLTEEDHDFNSRLKATIWWYVYRCDQS